MARKKLYELTEEHRAQLAPWRDRWIANAMSTAAMTDADRAACIQAVHGLYAAAKLPAPKAVVFVPSPFVLSFAGGFAAAIWHRHKATEEATREATYEATYEATREATREATYEATREATYEATREATWAATRAATWAATGGATEEATWGATYEATRAATEEATWAATWAATGGATEEATWGATWAATREATREATWAATGGATRAATEEATWAATWAATGGATEEATWGATRAATREATREATWAATYEATREATWAATRAATWGATWGATGGATYEATWGATGGATWAATYEATWEATEEATGAATEEATGAATLKNWYVVPCDMHNLANAIGIGEFGLQCVASAWRMWQGGNQWSGYDAYLSFFQDISGLNLPEYETYKHWRTLAEKSGHRIVHPDFCMISDRPEVLTVDEQNRPHNDDGPFCRWRDGFALYSVHGVRVPAWIIETPNDLTAERIAEETNSEIQRVMIERYGWDRYIADSNGQVVDHDERWGTLLKTPGGLVLQVINRSPEPDGTFRKYILPVADNCEPLPDPSDSNGELGDPQALTALNAVASTFEMRGAEYAAMLGAES